jgi:hypothetical protein
MDYPNISTVYVFTHSPCVPLVGSLPTRDHGAHRPYGTAYPSRVAPIEPSCVGPFQSGTPYCGLSYSCRYTVVRKHGRRPRARGGRSCTPGRWRESRSPAGPTRRTLPPIVTPTASKTAKPLLPKISDIAKTRVETIVPNRIDGTVCLAPCLVPEVKWGSSVEDFRVVGPLSRDKTNPLLLLCRD